MPFELLVELKAENVNWRSINEELKSKSKGLVEFFPILDFKHPDKCYLGLSVVNNNMSSDKIEAFKNSVSSLLNEGHSVYELYNASKFTKENMDALTKKFLG